MPTGAEHGLVLSLDYIVGMPISAAGNTGGINVAEAEHDLGHFDTAIEAALAYNKLSKKLFGITSSLNKVPDKDGN